MIRTLTCAALLAALTLPTLMSPALARADAPVVLARLPRERHAEMLAALRLELAGRATLLEGATEDGEPTLSSLREEARAAGASHVVWVVFPGGLLVPAEVRVFEVDRTSTAHAMTPQAWDVVDARLVAVLAASLLDAGSAEPLDAVSTAPEDEPVEPVAPTSLTTEAGAPTGDVALDEEASEGELMLREVELGDSRRARTFSFSVAALGFAHGEQALRFAMINQLGFYGRISEWASLGLRVRLGLSEFGSDTTHVTFAGGVPSIAASFRIPLGTASVLEAGVHVEGGIYLSNDYVSREESVHFGAGVGVFATLELGTGNGLQLDYSLDLFDFASGRMTVRGALSLGYVHRWDW